MNTTTHTTTTTPPALPCWGYDPTFDAEDDGTCFIPFSCTCTSEAEAIRVQQDVQSLCGARIEREYEYLYCLVEDTGDSCNEAIAELEGAGYEVEEV